MKNKFLIAVVGPTAVGKTALAIRLARHFQTEIISADARQIFRELNIGTAKPNEDELSSVKHHLVNSHSIYDDFNAGLFSVQAEELLNALFVKYDKVVLCGGSGLYIKALLQGFDEMPDVPSPVRQSVMDDFQKKGLEWLQYSVKEADPDYYEVADKQNSQRMMRALEVFRASGKPFSSFMGGEKKALPYQIIKIGLAIERSALYARIDQRMDDMIAAGLFQEAEKLYPNKNINALQTVGYQEIFDFMDGKYDKEEAIRLLKRNSRRYAKRQMTWFQKDVEIKWFNPKEFENIFQYIQEKSTILR